jgi:LacI family transcriptional regulator
MAIRLKDIARELNVSVITASKALRGNTDISEATRRRVLKRMKELDYQPNMTARSLATGHSYFVGLIVPDLLNPFFAELAKSISGALRKQSYGLILASSEGDQEIERSEIRMMLARGVDALLIASCQPALEAFMNEQNRRTPFVVLDRPSPHLRANFVGVDDYAGGMLAAEHLIQLGRKRLACIGSPDLSGTADRYCGFRAALQAHGIALREELVLPSSSANESGDGQGYGDSPDFADNEGYDLMRALLKRRAKPDGVFCHNDVIAIGAIKAALDAGLAIPKDIAFVGYDNVRYSKYLQIPLTSVDQRTNQLGESAAKLALDLVGKRIDKAKVILLTPALVVRESTVGSAQDAAIGQDTAIGQRAASGQGRRGGQGRRSAGRNAAGQGMGQS